MRLERLLPLVLVPNTAMAAGGGGGIVLGLIIFLPVLVWAFIRIWKFWFRMIFGGGTDQQPSGGVPQAISNNSAMKECPYCAEPILARARKCKHCSSELT